MLSVVGAGVLGAGVVDVLGAGVAVPSVEGGGVVVLVSSAKAGEAIATAPNSAMVASVVRRVRMG